MAWSTQKTKQICRRYDTEFSGLFFLHHGACCLTNFPAACLTLSRSFAPCDAIHLRAFANVGEMRYLRCMKDKSQIFFIFYFKQTNLLLQQLPLILAIFAVCVEPLKDDLRDPQRLVLDGFGGHRVLQLCCRHSEELPKTIIIINKQRIKKEVFFLPSFPPVNKRNLYHICTHNNDFYQCQLP